MIFLRADGVVVSCVAVAVRVALVVLVEMSRKYWGSLLLAF